MGFLVIFIQKAIGQGIGILYGALGEIMTEKSGNLNLGIPGMMYMGGIAGLIGAFLYENSVETPNGFVGLLISFFCAFACAALGGLVKLAGGVRQISVAVTGAAYKTPIPGLSKLGVVGQVLFSYGFLTYLAILLAIALAFFLSKTRKGLNLRAVGESPATADAAGINVTAYKYLATCIGGGISGLGGLYFVMEYSGGTWTNNGFGDRGWLAIALVIFALWKPVNAIWGSILFGGLYILYLYIPGLDRGAQEIFKALPYVVTIVVLVITSLRKKREYQPPQSLGLAYFREER